VRRCRVLILTNAVREWAMGWFLKRLTILWLAASK
jgi:hypothetical protein